MITQTGASPRGICFLVSFPRRIISFLFLSIFLVAHLGCEVKLRDAPNPCMVKGNLITPGTQVLIDSAFHLDALEDRETPLRMTLAMLQRLPLIGCLMAHGTGFYWAALQGVGTGSCDWLYE